MKKMKYNATAVSLSILGVILLYSGLAYAVGPTTTSFELNSINPYSFLEGVVFALGFGLGLPLWLSVVIIGLLSLLLFFGLMRIINRLL